MRRTEFPSPILPLLLELARSSVVLLPFAVSSCSDGDDEEASGIIAAATTNASHVHSQRPLLLFIVAFHFRRDKNRKLLSSYLTIRLPLSIRMISLAAVALALATHAISGTFPGIVVDTHRQPWFIPI